MDDSGRPLCAAFGIDLGSAGSRSDEALAQLVIEGIEKHHVVKVRGVDWDERRQLEMTARIGPVVGARVQGSDRLRPNVRHERGLDRYADRWHADLSWSMTDAVSVLVCTGAGRDPDPTCFLDTSAAVAALDRELMARATDRTVLHDLRHSRRLRPAGPLPSVIERIDRRLRRHVRRRSRDRVEEPLSSPASVSFPIRVPRQQGRGGTRRPLLDRCPRTGTPFLRIGDHAWRVSGLGTAASQVLLGELHEAIERREFIWQQNWQVGDVVAYDNRMVLHRRAGPAGSSPDRVLRRTDAEWLGSR